MHGDTNLVAAPSLLKLLIFTLVGKELGPIFGLRIVDVDELAPHTQDEWCFFFFVLANAEMSGSQVSTSELLDKETPPMAEETKQVETGMQEPANPTKMGESIMMCKERMGQHPF